MRASNATQCNRNCFLSVLRQFTSSSSGFLQPTTHEHLKSLTMIAHFQYAFMRNTKAVVAIPLVDCITINYLYVNIT